MLRETYELAGMGPTTANSNPARFVFLESEAAKARPSPLALPSMSKRQRQRRSPLLSLGTPSFMKNSHGCFPTPTCVPILRELIDETAFRNGSLHGGYFILAARALGLDCGTMSGFDSAKVNAEFVPGGKWKVNFLCNLGYGDPGKLYPRNSRLKFEEACRLL